MSTKKKTERDYPKKPVQKESMIAIDPAYSGRFRAIRRDPLDAELEMDDSMLARELRQMRVDEAMMRRRAKMAKLQKEIDDIEKKTGKTSTGSDMPGMTVAMAQQIANLPPEEQQKVIQTYAIFRGIDQSKGGQNALLPMLIGFSRTNPGQSQNQMAQYAKAMSDQFKTGVEVMKTAMPPREKTSSTTDMIKIFKDIMTENVQNPMKEMLKQMQPQPSAFEQILMNPELFSRAKEIGLFGGTERAGASTNIDLEIEKLRGEREFSIKKMDLEWRKMMLENEAKRERTNTILNTLTPLSALFAGPVDERMRQMGRQMGTPQQVQHPPVAPATNQPQQTLLEITCNACGHSEVKPIMGQVPDRIPCPGCGAELIVGGPHSGSS
jgi:ribosomal protein S27E